MDKRPEISRKNVNKKTHRQKIRNKQKKRRQKARNKQNKTWKIIMKSRKYGQFVNKQGARPTL